MSQPASTKPYLIRALYEWCTDNGFTPHITVKVQGSVRVPMEFVRNGEIVLNISFTATSSLHMDNIYVPIAAISSIYARENGQGMGFDVTAESEVSETNADSDAAKPAEKTPMSLAVTNEEPPPSPDDKDPKGSRKKPSLTVIK